MRKRSGLLTTSHMEGKMEKEIGLCKPLSSMEEVDEEEIRFVKHFPLWRRKMKKSSSLPTNG